ncbi:MAG: caspase family protein, partial [Cyanobacteria bacterium SBLK]|nr:caspase family protein [Cyanobacteria bacterium SBLK]
MMISNHKNLAILVGINAYGNGIPPLKTPIHDVTGLAGVLKSSYQYDIKLLLDSEATLEGINTLLKNLQDGILTLSENRVVRIESYNRVLFYFAGHGISEDAFENQDGPTGYLIPQDANKDDRRTFLQMQPLHDVLVELKCRHLLVILDCCFAGAFRFLRHLFPPQKLLYREQYDRFMKGKARQMIASASYDETALDAIARLGRREEKNTGENTGKNSPFAEVLLKALQVEVEETPNGGAKAPADIIPDGVITASELYIYLEKELAEITDRQTPGLYPLKHHEKGEYVFQIPGFVPENLKQAPSLDENTNPYRGLEPYEADNSELFFGREKVIQDLAKQVSDTSKSSLTVVLGVSGSGKSSLVKAGLIPRLLKEGWKIFEPIRPKDLWGKLILPKSTETKEPNEEVRQVHLSLLQSLQENLSRLKNDASDSDRRDTAEKFLLVIDQFEELVTQSSQQEKEQFVQWLQQLLTNHSEAIQVVITLRSEFEPQFASELLSSGKERILFAIPLIANEKLDKFIPILSQIYQNWAQKQWMAARFIVPAMTQDEFRQVIEKPALEKVLYFEPPELVDKLINEVLGMPGALPLLSFTLSELYLKYLKRRSDNRAMTQEDYQALGGVMGSLKTSATRVYDELVRKDSSYEQTIRHVMLRMVAVGGGQLARRAVPLSELEYPNPEENKRAKKVVDRFLEERLLVSGTDARYEPAHDALILGWDKLLEWKQDERGQENLLLQRQLTPVVEDWRKIEQSHNLAEPLLKLLDRGLDLVDNSWSVINTQFARLWRSNSPEEEQKNQKKSRFLWDSNPRLNLLEEVLNSGDNWLSKTEAEFVQSSIKQSRRNTAIGWSIAMGVIVSLSVFLILALISQRNALIGQVRSSQLASETSFISGDRQLEGLVEAVKAGKILQHNWLLQLWEPEQYLQSLVRGSLWKTLYQNQEQSRLSHQAGVNNATFSSDGNFIVTASDDDTARVWSIKGELITTLKGHQNNVNNATFSPDGNFIV